MFKRHLKGVNSFLYKGSNVFKGIPLVLDPLFSPKKNLGGEGACINMNLILYKFVGLPSCTLEEVSRGKAVALKYAVGGPLQKTSKQMVVGESKLRYLFRDGHRHPKVIHLRCSS